jgi:NADH-quinone oxidoreductase subunit B
MSQSPATTTPARAMSDQPGGDAAADPIVTTNTLWKAADPEAYRGGQRSEITHLAEFEASGRGSRDDARWSGALEIIPTRADVVLDLIRLNSLWPLLSGLACCAIEMAGPLIRQWDQMPEPKWCIALGDCTCSGGRYKRSYSTIQGIDRIMPVDIYISGCPPRPEALIYGFLKLQRLIRDRRGTWPDRAIGPTVPDLI